MVKMIEKFKRSFEILLLRLLRLCFRSINSILPGIFFEPADIGNDMLPLSFFSLPWVSLQKSKTVHFLLLHQPTFHSALKIIHLMFTTSFRHELMLNNTLWILFSLIITFVKMIKWEGPSIWCFGHYYDSLKFCLTKIL